MPFTLAHPAYVLPLRRLGLPVSALAVGSMVPDVPLSTTAVLAGVAGVVALALGTPVAQVARRTATQGVVATAVVLLVAACAWHLAVRSRTGTDAD